MRNKTHSQYWEHFFNNQNSISNKYIQTELYSILFGSLKPEQEKSIYPKYIPDSSSPDAKKIEYLYLSASVKRENGNIIPEIHDRESIQKDEEYFTKIEYTKSKFKENETYRIKRKTEFTYPKYTFRDFINWIELFSISVQGEDRLSVLNKSLLYQFICSEFRCTVDKDEKSTILNFSLDSRMSINYKTFYNRFNDILSKLKFKTRISHKQSKIAEIYSEGKLITASFFPIKKNDLANLNQLNFSTDIEINFYGLKIIIQNLEYILSYKKNDSEEILKGGFQNTPKYKLVGRIFYFLPTSIADIFIPGNIEGYISDYLELLTKPNETIGGNFLAKLKLNEELVEAEFESYTEVMQKQFRPLSNNKKDKSEGGDFFNDFKTKIIEDLIPQFDIK